MSQTIALVDDDRNILTSVQMALEAEGFAVRTYVDGEEALRDLGLHPTDLAVLDIKMPRLNGMELLQRLKQTPATMHMPIIFLTSKLRRGTGEGAIGRAVLMMGGFPIFKHRRECLLEREHRLPTGVAAKF